MPGTYAPPAVEDPNTRLRVGMPARLSAVRSWKVRPPRTKMSFWARRSAPADSVRLIVGSRFSRATSRERSDLVTEKGFMAPPLTVGSAPPTRHSTPLTQPIPATDEPPTG
jgi:hypothetical protein